MYILIAMTVIGLNEDEQKNVLQLTAAILHLGNISFVESRNFAIVQDERCNYDFYYANGLCMVNNE